jgi:broad specificity phosphatase PhoE
VQCYVDCIAAWLRGELDHRVPGGTSGHEFRARYDAAVRDIAATHHPDDAVAVFSHGAAIRVYAALAAGLDPGVSSEMSIMNTGLGLLEGHPDGGWRLSRWSSEPLGGVGLEDLHAHDVTGESTDEVAHECESPQAPSV